ncbi:hypothetical protein ACTS95_16190 [Empedobacter brevis]
MKKLVILSCLLFSSSFLKAEVKELHSTIVNFSNPWYNGYPVLLSENELPQEHLDEFNLMFVGMYPVVSENNTVTYFYGYVPRS